MSYPAIMLVSFTTSRLQWRKSVKRWSVLSQVLFLTFGPVGRMLKRAKTLRLVTALNPSTSTPDGHNQNPDFRMCRHTWRAEQIKETWTEDKSCCCSCSDLLLFLLSVSWVFFLFLNPSFYSLTLVLFMNKSKLRCEDARQIRGYLSEMLSVGVCCWTVRVSGGNSVTFTLITQLHPIIWRLSSLIDAKISYKSQFCFFFGLMCPAYSNRIFFSVFSWLPVSGRLEGIWRSMFPIFKWYEDVAGGKRLLSGAKQQPDEHSGHPREGWRWSDGTTYVEYLSYVNLILRQCTKATFIHMCMIAAQWQMTFYFSSWMLGQPDNWGDEPGEDCGQVVRYSNWHWNDDNCNNTRKYICKHINRKCRVHTHRPKPHRVAVIKVFLQPILGRSATWRVAGVSSAPTATNWRQTPGSAGQRPGTTAWRKGGTWCLFCHHRRSSTSPSGLAFPHWWGWPPPGSRLLLSVSASSLLMEGFFFVVVY